MFGLFELWAFITRQKVVYLKDVDGEITKTVAKKTPSGYAAKRHWPFHVRDVLLLDGGLVENGGYVVSWGENMLSLSKPLTTKPELIRADFYTFVGVVKVQVQGEYSIADHNHGWPAGYEIHRVWIESDLNATDLITMLTDKQLDTLQEAGVHWGEQENKR